MKNLFVKKITIIKIKIKKIFPNVHLTGFDTRCLHAKNSPFPVAHDTYD